MATCRACKSSYTADYTRIPTWCHDCEAKGAEPVLQVMAMEIKALSNECGAYMAIVWESQELLDRWSRVVDMYDEARHTVLRTKQLELMNRFRIKIEATIQKGDVIGHLCECWWNQQQRQKDYDELEWELFRAKKLVEKEVAQ